MKNLKDKVVWITGASSGIGEALVFALAKEGCKIILSSRRESELVRVKERCLSKFPDRPEKDFMVLRLDLNCPEHFKQVYEMAINELGRIDVLVNNGGISQRDIFANTNTDVFRQIMEVNFFGAMELTKMVLPAMIEQGSGMFIGISSVMGKFAVPRRSAYAASKHALNGFYDALRAELWDKNIEVLLVCPGYVKTQVSVNALKGDGQKQGTMDKGQRDGITPENCAKQIISAIKKGKREIYPGKFREVSAVYLKRFFPGILAKMVRKLKV